MGKTTLAMQIARNVAVSGNKALFISLEMLASELWVKAALGIAEVSWKDFSNGEVPAGTKERIQKEIIPTLKQGLGDRLYIYDKDQANTTTEMVSKIIDEIKPDIVIVDHLAYMADTDENEVDRLGLICRRLRTIAQEKNVAMLVLHHANRSTDDRKNQTKEPRMADIRGSGKIEQTADIILMPYIPANYEMREEKPRISLTYIPVVKNRIGQVGIHLVLYFDGLGQWFYRKNELPINLLGRDEE
jgi:replicative DNA helicase